MSGSVRTRRALRTAWLTVFLAAFLPGVTVGCGAPETDEGAPVADTVRAEAHADSTPVSAPAEPGKGEDPDPARDVPISLSCEGLERDILRTETTRAALEAAYGPPDSMSAETEPNRHVPDATDSLFVVHYPGLTVEIRRPPSGDDLTSHAAIRDNRYLARAAVGIGARADRVVSVLGEPRTRSEDRLVYDCGPHTEQPVTFWLADVVVERIEISYYVD